MKMNLCSSVPKPSEKSKFQLVREMLDREVERLHDQLVRWYFTNEVPDSWQDSATLYENMPDSVWDQASTGWFGFHSKEKDVQG